jgi:hypothetical protein
MLTLIHRGAAPYMKELRRHAQEAWDDYGTGVTTVGVAASQGHGLPVYGHSVFNCESNASPRRRAEMRESRAENAYGLLGEEVYKRPFGGLQYQPGQCAEFATMPPFFPKTLPDPREVNDGKCFQCNQKITTLAMDVRQGFTKPMCGHCRDLAWTATRKYPGLQIVDLGDPYRAPMSSSMPEGAPLGDTERFKTYEDEASVSGFSCPKSNTDLE